MRKRPGSLLQALSPAEIRAVYELHSHNSTATNDALVALARLNPGLLGSSMWLNALRASHFSMWLHQVLSFEYATRSFVDYARGLARKGQASVSVNSRQLKAQAKKLWPKSGSAQRIHINLREMGLQWSLASDRQFKLELQVAPRHYVWRDAWAHCGGRLREYDRGAYEYFHQKSFLEDRDGVAWPQAAAWTEARLCFSKLIDTFVESATQPTT